MAGKKIVWELMARGQLENYVPYREKQVELTLFANDACVKNRINFCSGRTRSAFVI